MCTKLLKNRDAGVIVAMLVNRLGGEVTLNEVDANSCIGLVLEENFKSGGEFCVTYKLANGAVIEGTQE